MICVIVGNALTPSPEKLRKACEDADFVVAVDGGARFCAALSILPDMIIGDLDSIPDVLLKDLQKKTKIYKFPKDKDHTDLNLALLEAERLGAKKIQVFSWADERLDYSLAALIDSVNIKARIEFINSTSKILVLNSSNKNLDFKEKPGTKISIFPLQTPITIRTSGLKWKFNLKKERRPVFSQSNELVSNARITVSEGAVFIVVAG